MPIELTKLLMVLDISLSGDVFSMMIVITSIANIAKSNIRKPVRNLSFVVALSVIFFVLLFDVLNRFAATAAASGVAGTNFASENFVLQLEVILCQKKFLAAITML